MLCPFHHRALHAGEFSIDGDPEAGTLRFLDRFGRPIAPPDPRPPDGDPPGLDPPGDGPPAAPPVHFTPPLAERLRSDWFTWN